MRLRILPLSLLFSALPALAVNNGDSLDQVVAEKGPPVSRLERGAITMLTFADAVVRLENGQVVAVQAPSRDYAVKAVASERFASAPASASVRAGEWTTDFVAAFNANRNEHKKLFLLFTGTDWCPWCQRLEKEILSTTAFNDYARDNLFLVKLDFPRRSPQPPDLKKQNQMLEEKFGIKGYPTVIVINAEGHFLGKLGYQPGGPEAFLEELRKL